MQQKLCSRSASSFLLEKNVQACGAVPEAVSSCKLPFRCPRCGEQERFCSLASLRAHLEYRHSYRSPDVTSGSFSITGKLPDPLTAAIPWHEMSLPTRRGQQSTGRAPHVRSLSDSRDSGPFSGLQAAAASAAVRRRLASMLRAADSTMQRRLARLSTELAQTDTELLCERAHSQHLAQERQEVADRERSLSQQVDVAVMVIAALKEQLNASENELERREREVSTIQKFLDAAVRQETSGKVRIQEFIENLLTRIALTERLVEYYQALIMFGLKKSTALTLSPSGVLLPCRSAGGQLFSSGFSDRRTQSFTQFGGRPPPSKGERDREREHRERLAQSSRLFCRPEHRNDIWNHQRRRSTGYEA
uniref:Zinc finger protein 365 n=1 Tax=Oryzias latipes TaxID=8090 RepID=A0A3P9LB51_ORYLA